jgi:hypothetical protein
VFNFCKFLLLVFKVLLFKVRALTIPEIPLGPLSALAIVSNGFLPEAIILQPHLLLRMAIFLYLSGLVPNHLF